MATNDERPRGRRNSAQLAKLEATPDELVVTCARMLGHSEHERIEAVAVLRALSERPRLRYLEALSRASLQRRDLANVEWATRSGNQHRLRRLEAAGVLTRIRGRLALRPESLKATARYFDVLSLAASLPRRTIPVSYSENEVDERQSESSLDEIFISLSDPGRRMVFERIVVMPGNRGEIARALSVETFAISHHLRSLLACGLVMREGNTYLPNVDLLPKLRLYFDRLWLEAELGDAWLKKRGNSLVPTNSDL